MNSIWIARDKDGSLNAFESRPERDFDGLGVWYPSDDTLNTSLHSNWFPELQWEDEPIKLIPDIEKTCGNCYYFMNEQIDGTGICHSYKTKHFVNDEACREWERK